MKMREILTFQKIVEVQKEKIDFSGICKSLIMRGEMEINGWVGGYIF